MIQPVPPEELARALEQARAAQEDWARQTVGLRTRWLAPFRAWLAARPDLLCQALDHEVGKSREECLASEILPLASACSWLAGAAGRLLAPRRAQGTPFILSGGTDHVHRRPHGVVGIIGTWNYPLLLSGVQVAQALVAGNAVAFKPSEKAPGCGKLLIEGMLQAGVPESLILLVESDPAAGEALVAADIDHLVFTGSGEVGRRIAGGLGPRLVSSTLELSGHDAMFVLSGADPVQAARAAWFGATANSGRTCMATRRCLVAKTLIEPFRNEIARLAANPPVLVLDKPAGAGERLSKARELASQAVAQGARHLRGDGKEPPFLVENVRPEMAIWRQDAFVPILAIMSCDGEGEMLKADKACPFGLGAAVFGKPGEAMALASRLRAGLVTINDALVAAGHPDTPLCGSGASGWGSTQGSEGLLGMTVPQAIRVSRGVFRPHYGIAIPGHADMGDMLEGLLRGGHGRGWLGRLWALLALPGQAWRWWRGGNTRGG